jgi:hypothetical protein
MCVWLSNTPPPANHDGCEPVEVATTTRKIHPLWFASPVVIILALTMSSDGTLRWPSSSTFLTVVAVAAGSVLFVGVGVLRSLSKAPATSTVTVLSAERVHALAASTLARYAALHGYTPSPAVVQAMLPPLATFRPMTLDAAHEMVALITADILNAHAVRIGSIHRVAPSHVRQLVEAVQ